MQRGQAFGLHQREGLVHVDTSQIAHKKEAGLLLLNTERAATRLGWNAVLTFAETAKMTMDWYKLFYSGDTAGAIALTTSQVNDYAQKARARGTLSVAR